MQELFWFFLGAFVYLLLDRTIGLYKKISFINDIKIHAFQLIGFAYEQLVFATATKYLSLEKSGIDPEKIKVYKNIDETAFLEWKKEVVFGLKDAVPPIYKEGLEIENWDDIMKSLETHYKEMLRKKHRKEKADAQNKEEKIK